MANWNGPPGRSAALGREDSERQAGTHAWPRHHVTRVGGPRPFPPVPVSLFLRPSTGVSQRRHDARRRDENGHFRDAHAAGVVLIKSDTGGRSSFHALVRVEGFADAPGRTSRTPLATPLLSWAEARHGHGHSTALRGNANGARQRDRDLFPPSGKGKAQAPHPGRVRVGVPPHPRAAGGRVLAPRAAGSSLLSSSSPLTPPFRRRRLSLEGN